MSFDAEYKAAIEELADIDELVAAGILGDEQCPSADHLHWAVLKPELLPDWLQNNYKNHGEVRWYRN